MLTVTVCGSLLLLKMVFRKFNIRERSDMIQIYFLNNKSATAARRQYIRLYPERQAPSQQIFTRLAKKFEENGNVSNVKKVCRNRSVLNEENKINILGFFEAHPVSAITTVYKETGISRGSIHSVLKEYKFKAYKFRRTQKLSEGQCQKRMQFCVEFMNRYNENNNFLKNILWTDESSFTTKKGCNRQNTRFWSINNPRQIHQIKTQGYQSLTIWCGVIGTYVLGPIFIDQRLTGGHYLNLLEHQIAQYIEDLPLNISAQIIWQQDGAPPHNVAHVKNFLNMEYPRGWLGNGGPIDWPPNSPDLTVMDFFFWGYIKNNVHKTPCDNIVELRQRISAAVNELRDNPEYLLHAINHTIKIYEKCIEQNGGHIQQYLE